MQYTIKKDGTIYNNETGRYLKPYTLDIDGRSKLHVNYFNKRAVLSRVILKTFRPIENDRKYAVEYKDGDIYNCALSNLSWKPMANVQREIKSIKKQKRGVRLIHDKWIASLTVSKKTIYIGSFETKEEAYEAFRKEYLSRFGLEPW